MKKMILTGRLKVCGIRVEQGFVNASMTVSNMSFSLTSNSGCSSGSDFGDFWKFSLCH